MSEARSVFFLAELPYHDLLRKRDPEKARKLEAKMQQILGEAVYLSDGRVIDSMGPRMIAIMPDSSRALEAARKSQSDLLEYNSRQPPRGDVVEPTLVVHSGQQISESSPTNSAALTQGLQILRSMQPLQLLVSEAALREAGSPIPAVPVGEVSGVKFYEPPPEEPKPVPSSPQPVAVPITDTETRRRGDAGMAISPRHRVAASPRLLLGGGAGLLALLIALAIVFLLKGNGETPPTPAATATMTTPAPRPAPPVVEPLRTTVSLSMSDPRMSRVAEITRAVLVRSPRIDIVPENGSIVATLAPDPAKRRVFTATVGPASASPVPLDRPAQAAAQILGMIADAGQLQRNELTSKPEVIQKFADASRTRNAKLLQTVITADPAFVPALHLGLELFAADPTRTRLIQVAEKLLAVHPEDLAIRKDLALWLIGSGRPAEAVPHLQTLLQANSDDADALFAVARLSWSVFDQVRFREAARRHAAVTGSKLFHDADLDFAQGQIDKAVRAYYEAERADPNNAALALKIGRIAVLRHSMTMADLELEKLRRLDPNYGFPLLQAYVAAEKRSPQEAERYLAVAQLASTWKEDPYTAAAEVHAILSQHAKVMESLQAAAARGESTLTYILSNPLFRYLEDEADYQTLRAQLEQKRDQLRAALQNK